MLTVICGLATLSKYTMLCDFALILGGGDPNALQLKPRPLLCLACMQLHAALCRLVIAVIIFSHFLDLRINKIPYN